ncbi:MULTISPECIES: chalcone isomerase family protein [Gammaproteobacteria]|uniref:chalcone isomerase family protein n=1 Tax=Gammaproteobacteria TaxID=1236 RepID=UPI001404094C|nr:MULTISPECIES: chalcone isomerase family protein [Gammaproteobacteria]
MKWLNTVHLVGVVALSVGASANACEMNSENLQRVGETRLEVFFFDVYDAALFTDTGRYPEAQTIRLRLDYLRDFKARSLIERTEEEWLKLDIQVGENHQRWLEQLYDTWPDITKGDCLVAQWDKASGLQFYTKEGAVGELFPDEFAADFLAIWLSENASYRRNRDELVGENNG